MTSFSKPTDHQIEAAVLRMSSPQHERYFLDRLDNPYWIAPLRERGFFKYPAPIERLSGGGVRSSNWPASKYLARMAKHSPKEVAEILADIETENPSVISDIIHAALAMRVDLARTLVPMLCRAFESKLLWFPFDDANDLCERLALEGEVDAAMQLADVLFTPRNKGDEQERTRDDEYWYKEGLRKIVPLVASRHGRVFVPKLCGWLIAWVDSTQHVDPESGSDYSYSWRPAIEEHEQNKTYQFAGEMVGFVREGFEKAIQHEQLTLDDALGIIDKHPYLVFKRLRLHLINEFAEKKPELARQVMMDRELFDNYEYKHEYAMLMGRRLSVLTKEERETWFSWIDAGPDMSDYDDLIRSRFDREATEEDRRNRIEYWQFEKLHWVRTHLEGDRKRFYDRMLAKHGEPMLADLVVRSGEVKRGHDSPMEVSELQDIPFAQAVEKVVAWESTEKSQFRGPSIEELASTFRQLVATDPEAFSREAGALENRPAIYVRGFISQMTQAAKEGKDIDILSIAKLCNWVIQQPVDKRTTPEDEPGGLIDSDWQWTRDEISAFAQAVCEARTDNASRYPLEELRDAIWTLIEPLCRDRVKSYAVRETDQEDPRIHEYLDLGINSPRGKAVTATLEYARWVANYKKKFEGNAEYVPGGFELIPEVRTMLEWQIDSQNSSVEVMSVIGSRIGLIYWIDKNWLAKHVTSIFDLKKYERESRQTHGWSAWNSFLVWVRPHIEFYRLFKEQFDYAVDQASGVDDLKGTRRQPMCRLGEHLMILYGRGQLGLEEDNGLLKRFLFEALPEIRQHAIEFVGQSLKGDEDLEKEVTERFMKLWDEYWAKGGQSDAKQSSNGRLFGTWFSSGKFPEQWSLERLEKFVEVISTPEPEHSIAERLAEIASVDMARAVRILNQVIRGSTDSWRLHYWQKPAKRILAEALKTTQDVKESAKQIINYLGRLGYMDLRKLLKV